MLYICVDIDRGRVFESLITCFNPFWDSDHALITNQYLARILFDEDLNNLFVANTIWFKW